MKGIIPEVAAGMLRDKDREIEGLKAALELCRAERPKMAYVITAYRWGNRENHSYVVGISFEADQARAMATEEEDERGGKYACEILELPFGSREEEDVEVVVELVAMRGFKPGPPLGKETRFDRAKNLLGKAADLLETDCSECLSRCVKKGSEESFPECDVAPTAREIREFLGGANGNLPSTPTG